MKRAQLLDDDEEADRRFGQPHHGHPSADLAPATKPGLGSPYFEISEEGRKLGFFVKRVVITRAISFTTTDDRIEHATQCEASVALGKGIHRSWPEELYEMIKACERYLQQAHLNSAIGTDSTTLTFVSRPAVAISKAPPPPGSAQERGGAKIAPKGEDEPPLAPRPISRGPKRG